jgi:hypothetical protein
MGRFNYHLKRAGSARRVNNFTADIRDSECYTVLLNQLAPQQCGLDALREQDPLRRAEYVRAPETHRHLDSDSDSRAVVCRCRLFSYRLFGNVLVARVVE